MHNKNNTFQCNNVILLAKKKINKFNKTLSKICKMLNNLSEN